MITQQELFGKVCDTLGALTYSIRLRSAGGDLGVNKAAEAFYCGLLNIILEPAYPGIRLENMNIIQDNYPAIDLGDRDKGLAVQVTTTEHRSKVNHTLEKFFEKNLDGAYGKLILLVIGKKDAHKKPFTVLRGFDFDPNRDIWDLDRLGQELGKLDQDVLERLDDYLNEKLSLVPRQERVLRLKFPASLSKDAFVGREQERRELTERMADGANTPILISGLGGMGKTELAARFCADYTGGNVYFLRFRESFTKTVAMGVAEGIEGYLDQKPSEKEAYDVALNRLRNFSKGDILVIDNADEPSGNFGALTSDPAYLELKKMELRLIITTRCEVPRAVRVGHMENATLYQIFENHECVLTVPQMDDLIGAVNGHTMTVDLMARTLKRNRRLTVEKLLEALREGDLAKQNYRPVVTDRNGGEEQAQIYAHLSRLFNVAEVTEEGRDLLRNMVLLPEGGMDMAILEAVFDEAELSCLDEQIDHGWLAFDEKTRFVSIHPVIRLVCRTELNPDDENCGAFLYAISDMYDPNQYDAEKFRQFAELFSQAADILPDLSGEWSLRAGHLWSEIGQAENALYYTTRTVNRREKSMPDTEELAVAYNNAGLAWGNIGNYGSSLEYMLKALAIWEKILLPVSLSLARSLNNIGSAYRNLGNHKTALEFSLKAMEILEKMMECDPLEQALSYNNVGCTYRDLGDYSHALEYMQKAMAIRESTLPYDHPDLAESYNNVGYTFNDLGEFNKALEYLLKAMEIREKVLPTEHPDLASSYNNIGNTYGILGDHKTALEYHKKSLAIWEKALPLDHPDIAKYYNNLGTRYIDIGNYDLALKYLLKALSIREERLPCGHPDLAESYGNVGSAYGFVGDREKEIKYGKKALDIQEKVLPPEHPHLAISYNNLGSAYVGVCDYEKGLEFQLKALELQEKLLQRNHPNIASFCGNIAWTYQKLGNYYTAWDYAKRAVRVAKACPSGQHPDLENFKHMEKELSRIVKRR